MQSTHPHQAGHLPHGAAGRRPFAMPDYKQAPLLLIWEITRACALACRHCRAAAIDSRDPGELSLEEGKTLIEQTKKMGTPILVLSGGDPLQRDDLEDLIRHGKSVGLRMGTIPAATERLTRERIESIGKAGVDQVAFSLDASTAEAHDNFRQVPGSFERTMQGARFAREAGIPLQINTCFGAWNLDDFDNICQMITDLGVVFWEVFLLVPVGRGEMMKGLTPRQNEEFFEKLYRISENSPFVVKVTEAQHYRRFVLEKKKEEAQGRAAFAEKEASQFQLSAKVVNAGNGFCFVDHVGDVYPSGFLPLVAGNVRDQDVAEIYRKSPLFRELRDTSLLKGRCGICEYKEECGGSRSRAYALTGDYLASSPECAYKPRALRGRMIQA